MGSNRFAQAVLKLQMANMANVEEEDAIPLMENPRPVPGQDPEFAPPPYSSLPYPVQVLMSENSAIYNPTGQMTMDNEKPMAETAINPMYARTTYDPMENEPQMNPGSTPQAANARRKAKALPLMGTPRPVPGRDLGFAPPPYSTLNGSQPQAYRPVSPPPTEMPGPVQVPMFEDPAIYNPMGQATMGNGEPMAEPASNPTSAVTTYDFMANDRAANYRKKTKCYCRFFKISSMIGAVGIVLLIALKAKAPYSRESSVKNLNDTKPNFRKFQGIGTESLGDGHKQAHEALKEINNPSNALKSDRHPLDNLIKQDQLSLRQRRDLETSSKKMNLGTRKMKYHKARKFTS